MMLAPEIAGFAFERTRPPCTTSMEFGPKCEMVNCRWGNGPGIALSHMAESTSPVRVRACQLFKRGLLFFFPRRNSTTDEEREPFIPLYLPAHPRGLASRWQRGDDPSSSSKDLPRSLCLYLKWREGRKEGRKAGKGRKRSGRARTAGRERGFQSVGPRRLCARTNSPPQLGGGTSGTGNEGSTGKISNLAPSSLY